MCVLSILYMLIRDRYIFYILYFQCNQPLYVYVYMLQSTVLNFVLFIL